MRPRADTLAPEQRYAAAIVGILLLILGLVLTVTWQAWRAARAQRAIADAAIADQVTFAAGTWRARVNAQIYTALTNAFLPLAAFRGRDGPGPWPSIVMAAIDSAVRCDCVPILAARHAFRVDLRSGALVASGPQEPDADERRWLGDAITAHAERTYERQWPFALFAAAYGDTLRLLSYTLVRGRDGDARFAFGFVSDSTTLVRDVFALQYGATPLIIDDRLDSLPRDSVVSVTARLPSGRTLYQSPSRFPERYAGQSALGPWMGDLRFAVALNPAVAPALVGSAAGRFDMPLLGVVLLLTGVLLSFAVVLIWRTTSLARLRADFTASVSHELRTPLAQIMLFAETMAHGRLASVADYRRESNVILQEGRRLLHLVENVLHFARAERLAMPLTVRPHLLGPIVRGAVQSFAPLAAESDLVVRTAIDDEVGAHVDADAVRRALTNLLENALKYGGAGQQIIVGVTMEQGCARIRVDDRGPGVPVRDRERIWRPFTRMEREMDQAIAGSGIGLAIVRDIVHRHRGRAWVEDSPLGGARFVLEFPAAWRTERAQPLARSTGAAMWPMERSG